MSTTFGILVPSSFDVGTEVVEIAFRGNGTGVRFTNPLAQLLSDNIEVIPMDNSPQSIFTIGDIKKAIEKQNKQT